MIEASEALGLATAQLSDEDSKLVDSIEAQLTEHIKTKMERRGVDMKFDGITNSNVLAEINQRLKRAGWMPTWQPLVEPHPLHQNKQRLTGYMLSLAPSDTAYATYYAGSAH
jgi:hypothetical protein